MSGKLPLRLCKHSILQSMKLGVYLEHCSLYSMGTSSGGGRTCSSVCFFRGPREGQGLICCRRPFCHDWNSDSGHLYAWGARPFFPEKSQPSDNVTKHLAGHQFVIGRLITGTFPASFRWSFIDIERVLPGFGNGLNTATVPSWQAECSKSKNRGLLICIEASMIAVGTVTAYWIVSFVFWGSFTVFNSNTGCLGLWSRVC